MLDSAAVAEHYRRYGPLIYRRCLRFLWNEDDARDGMQEVFVQMLAELHRIQDPDKALHWLYRVSTNYCLKRLRRHPLIVLRPPAELPEIEVESRIERVLVAREQLTRVLARESERDQAIFALAFVDDMSQEEVAAVMDLSRRTVGKVLRRLKRTFREDLS